MNWHPTNYQAAIGLIVTAIGGVLIVWELLQARLGKPEPGPGDSPVLSEPVKQNAKEAPFEYPQLDWMPHDEPALKIVLGEKREFRPAPAPPALSPKALPRKKSLTKTQKRVSAKRTTAAKP